MIDRDFIGLPDRLSPDPFHVRSLFGALAEQPVETAGFAYFDRTGRLQGMRTVRSAARDTVAVSFRAIATDVLAFDAAAVIMAHNHPSGDAQPSAADRALTKRLAIVLDTIGTRLIDHVIVTATAAISLRALGLL